MKFDLFFSGLLIGMTLMFLTMHEEQPQGEPVIHAYTIEGADTREMVACEFEQPLKYVNLINHWYDTHVEMFADYLLLVEPEDESQIWGWSSCVWQEEDNWAACELYLVKPDFVHASMNIDTMGHELLHGSCGDYHE